MIVIKVEINNRQDVAEVTDELKDIFSEIARKVGELEGYDNGEISLALVDNQMIQELNQKYRDVDEATDVLSFPMDEELWGDVIISTERAVQQAREYGHSLERELAFLFTHGILHLLGYDHQAAGDKQDMHQKEERILGELNITRD
ncbi:MAG: rRNA maturation RNase YbeY [Bacillota bacterium]